MESLKNLGALIALIGFSASALTAVAFWLFKLFGEKWLTAKFHERLEDYKHAQQKELEQLRFTINTMMDRTTKLHQHEFEVLPKVWALLSDAYGEAQVLTHPFQSYPDLNRMSEAHLAEFLEKSPLEGWQKAELAEQPDKTNQYMRQIFWHDLRRVNNAKWEFHSYLVKNGIFIQADMKARLRALDDMIDDAVFEKKIEEENPMPRPERFEKSRRLRAEGPELLKAIEADISNRLWSVELKTS